MSAFLHELVARIRATHIRAPETSNVRSHRDACHAAKAPHAATSRKWVIAGLR